MSNPKRKRPKRKYTSGEKAIITAYNRRRREEKIEIEENKLQSYQNREANKLEKQAKGQFAKDEARREEKIKKAA